VSAKGGPAFRLVQVADCVQHELSKCKGLPDMTGLRRKQHNVAAEGTSTTAELSDVVSAFGLSGNQSSLLSGVEEDDARPVCRRNDRGSCAAASSVTGGGSQASRRCLPGLQHRYAADREIGSLTDRGPGDRLGTRARSDAGRERQRYDSREKSAIIAIDETFSS